MMLSSLLAAATAAFYGFAPSDISGKPKSLERFKGEVLLVVNTASQCGYTPQYAGLEDLQKRYGSRGFKVLAFPSNDFGGQEPGSDREIQEFCDLKFKTTFPLFAKVKVSGADAVPLYDWLKNSPADAPRGEVEWNFEKFLLDRKGQIRGRFKPGVEPSDPQIATAIERLLTEGK